MTAIGAAASATSRLAGQLGPSHFISFALIVVLAGGGWFLADTINTSQREVVDDVHEIHEEMKHVVTVVETGNSDSNSRFDRMMTIMQRLVDAQVATCWAQSNGDQLAQSICATIGQPPPHAAGLQR